jgi:hypothetical protein
MTDPTPRSFGDIFRERVRQNRDAPGLHARLIVGAWGPALLAVLLGIAALSKGGILAAVGVLLIVLGAVGAWLLTTRRW